MFNKKLTGVLAAAALVAGSSVAQAQDTQVRDLVQQFNWYAGANAIALDASAGNVPDESSLMGLYGRAGMFINPNFSAEVRVGTGLSEDDVTVRSEPNAAGVVISEEGTLQASYFYGIYARGGLAMTESIYPYAVLGYTRSQYEITTDSGDFRNTEYDLSYGVGVDFELQQGLTINLEYAVLVNKPDYQMSGISLGASMAFE